MALQTLDLEVQANDKTPRELAETDLERITAGKDGKYWWGTISSNTKEAAARDATEKLQERHGFPDQL
jgi:hypothetical protein